MKNIRANTAGTRLRMFVIAMAFVAVASAVRADVMVANPASVRAGIIGTVHHSADNSIGVDFLVIDPTGTNVTMFTIQRSFDLKTWVDYSSTVTVTGSFPLTEISDFATSTPQFYRMRLINFR